MDKKLIMRRMLRSGFFITGAIILTLIIVLSLLAPVICRYSPTASSLKDRLMAPEWFSRGLDGHILGTDHMGRDLFTRLLYGARISIFIAVVVCVSSAIIGTCLGLVAGYFGGLADSIIMRAIEVLQAIPNIILAICVLSLLGASTTNLIIILVRTVLPLSAQQRNGVPQCRFCAGQQIYGCFQLAYHFHSDSAQYHYAADRAAESGIWFQYYDRVIPQLFRHGYSGTESVLGQHDLRWPQIFGYQPMGVLCAGCGADVCSAGF